MSILAEFWGEYGCFSRPEFKTERVSYDVITPSAARGMLESIMWHPGLAWVIDRIYVRAPIEFVNIRRNEVSAKISASNVRTAMKTQEQLYLATKNNIQQRSTMALVNVRYIVEAHFNITEEAAPGDNPGKFQEMIKRRLRKGQCYSQPYLGTREFASKFALCEGIPPCPKELLGEKDLGFMLYDMDFTDPDNIQAMYYRAIMQDGKIDLTNVEVMR